MNITELPRPDEKSHEESIYTPYRKRPRGSENAGTAIGAGGVTDQKAPVQTFRKPWRERPRTSRASCQPPRLIAQSAGENADLQLSGHPTAASWPGSTNW